MISPYSPQGPMRCHFFPRFAIVAALSCLVCLAFFPLAALSQATAELESVPPVVTISPGTNSYSADSVAVTITWSDNTALNPSSRSITINGVEVGGMFTYTGTATHATSVAKVRLVSGSNVLSAEITDVAGNGALPVQVTYTYTPPSPPATSPPPSSPPSSPPVAYTYAVQVTPDAGDSVRVTTGAYASGVFTVTNTGTGQADFLIAAVCNGLIAAGPCLASRDTVTLAAGESRQVGVLFQAGATDGATGTATLTARRVADATVSDNGWRGVRLIAAGPPSYLGDGFPGPRPIIDRGGCLKLSLGPAAASECGDLRLAHALPATRTLNSQRSPVLLYSSQQAYPNTIVGTTVSPSVGSAWDSISAVVRRGGVTIASGRWPGWVSGSRRIALIVQETGGTGVFDDTLLVSSKAGGVWSMRAVLPSRHIVVDRRYSEYGAGWWLAGLERLFFAANAGLLWVGGDGSARLYQWVARGRWVSAEPSAPDTIRWDSVTFSNGAHDSAYVRVLPGKGRVAYDLTGRQLYTQNRLGQTTRFLYDASGRLSRLVLATAVPDDTSYTYRFIYNNPSGSLSAVIAPHVNAAGDRQTSLSIQPVGGLLQLSRITDFPGTTDSLGVSFAYDGVGRAITRTDEAGTPTRFLYDGGSRIGLAYTVAFSNGKADTAQIRISAQESLGLPGPAGSQPAIPMDQIGTGVDGPARGPDDFAYFYMDANGRVRQSSSPMGFTRVYREDPRYPALVTRTVAPTGQQATATYDGRGRLVSQTEWNPLGDGRNATTFYSWNDTWDEVERITSPTGITTTYGYDGRGLREWQQIGADSARGVRYTFNAQGQVRTVRSESARLRGESAETIDYDPITGNLVAITSPLGIRTVMLNDRIGRAVRTIAPIDSLPQWDGTRVPTFAVDSTVYDVAGRVRETFAWGQEQPYYLKMDGRSESTREATLHVRNDYDGAGRLWTVERQSLPDSARVGILTTRFEYDGFGRKIAEIATDGQRDRYYYDAAGRDTLTINRRGEPIRAVHDAMGRVVRREMAGDTSTFVYHPVTGAMLAADNAHARIRRSYYPNGLLKGDTSWVARGDGTFGAGVHVYGLRYDYDLEGRRTALSLPDSVRPSDTQSGLRYAYDPVTGALDRITDPLGNAYTFRYRTDGALDTLAAPSGVIQTHRYDADGRLILRMRGDRSHPVLYRDSLTYDLRGKVTFAQTLRGTTTLAYDGLGHLVHSFSNEWTSGKVPQSEEEYRYDALGNKLWHRRTSFAIQDVTTSAVQPTVEYYQPGTARDTGTVAAPGVYFGGTIVPAQSIARRFDQAGNLYQMHELNPVQLMYGAVTTGSSAGRTTAFAEPDGSSQATRSDQDGQQQVLTTYTYRADGKLTRVQRDGTCVYLNSGPIGGCTTQQPAYDKQPRGELFRYDALGRRVWVRTVTNTLCFFRCDNTTRRTVWDGDQVLAEIRYPNSQPEQDSGLDSANVHAKAERDAIERTPSGNLYGGRNTSDWAQHGRVLHVHGGGMDQPLGLIRMDYSYDFPDAVVVIPHAGWRGTYEMASFSAGGCKWVTLPSYQVVRQDSTGRGMSLPAVDQNGVEYDVTQQRCMEIDFPGKYQGMSRFLRRQTLSGPISWMGSLVQDAQDASGLMFRRNRYYDPASGRFTQEDPIGLAGGVNSYGFAEGDPIGFSDPYGLASDTMPHFTPAAGTTTVVGGGAAIGEGIGAAAAGTAAIGAVAAYAAYREFTQRVHLTYTLTNPVTGQVYSGRTSGFGDPESIMRQRYSRHHMRAKGFVNPQLDKVMVGEAGEDAIRGREQQLIDHYGGARNDGGTSGNSIRGIRKWNPFGRIYHAEANLGFGELHPYTGSF